MADLITAEQARALREGTTLGPWEWDEDHWLTGVRPVAAASCLEPCCWPEDVRGIGFAEADGRLIAAAPDLAATVEALWEQIERALASHDMHGEDCLVGITACNCWRAILRGDRR